jgi:hypothetical protein
MSMKFQLESVVTGVKAFNQSIDGVAHDFTKVSVMTDFADGVGFGGETVAYKWGNHTNCSKIQDLEFPFKAKLEMELATTGSRQTTVILNVTPLTPPPTK